MSEPATKRTDIMAAISNVCIFAFLLLLLALLYHEFQQTRRCVAESRCGEVSEVCK